MAYGPRIDFGVANTIPFELVGTRVKHLTVVKYLGKIKKEGDKNRKDYYDCVCACGNHREVCKSWLTNHQVAYCGADDCPHRREKVASSYQNFDSSLYINKVYGHLTVVRLDDSAQAKAKCKGHFFVCVCDCGRESSVLLSRLENKVQTACSDRNCPYSKLGKRYHSGFLVKSS